MEKIKLFSNKEKQLALYSKALAHPARISILKTIAKNKECICGDLVLDLPLAQSTVSQHLKALKEIGLIQGEVEGPRSKYCINWGEFDNFLCLFEELQLLLIKHKSNSNKCD